MSRISLILGLQFILLLVFSNCEPVNQKKMNTRELQDISKHVQESGGITQARVLKDTVNWVGMWKGEGKREIFIKNLINEFNFSHPDVYINFKFREEIPEFLAIESPVRDMPDALFTARMIQENRYDWDIILMLSSSMYQYVGDELGIQNWGEQYLVDFADVSGFFDTQNPDVVVNEAYRDPYDGLFMGPMIEGAYFVMYCNQDMANTMGLDIKQFDMTADDLLGYLEKIKAYNDTNGSNIAVFHENYDWITMVILFEHLFKSLVHYSLDYAAPEKFSYDHQMAFKQCLDVFEEMGKYNPVIDSQSQNAWATSRHRILDNEAVFYINGTWMFNMWESIDSSKVNKMIPCELPVFDKMNFYIGEYKSNYAVLKESPNKEIAVKALMQLASEDAAVDWVRMAKSPTGIKMEFEQFGTGGDANETFVIQMIQKYGKNIGNRPLSIFGTQNAGVGLDGQALLGILRGERTAEDVFNEYMAMNLD